jgi:hypothetical protein
MRLLALVLAALFALPAPAEPFTLLERHNGENRTLALPGVYIVLRWGDTSGCDQGRSHVDFILTDGTTRTGCYFLTNWAAGDYVDIWISPDEPPLRLGYERFQPVKDM